MLRWPYDETRFERIDDSNWAVTSPWVKTRFEVPPDSLQAEFLARFEQLRRAVDEGAAELGLPELQAIEPVLEALKALPVSYLLPRAGLTGAAPLAGPAIPGAALSTPISLLEYAAPELVAENPDFWSAHLPATWLWSTDECFEFSRLSESPPLCDPLSASTVLRRYFLLDSLERNRTKDLYAALDAEPAGSETLKRAVGLLVSLNHHVTLRCEPSIRPALDIAGPAEQAVLSFLDEEKGHDLLVGQAVKDLDPATLPARAPLSARALMKCLEGVARHSMLGLSAAVNLFERNIYEAEDPFARYLKKIGKPLAAAIFQKHRDINTEGEHENEADAFLDGMGPIGPEYLEQAGRWVELVTVVAHTVSTEVIAELAALRR
jgi:hypothetical protein